MQTFLKRVTIAATVFVLFSCRVLIEPKLTMAQILSADNSLIPTYISVVTDKCDTESPRRFFLGVIVNFEGCRRKGDTYVKEWSTDILFVHSPDIESLKTTPIALFKGKGNTLIMFLQKDVLEGIRKELFENNDSDMSLMIKFDIMNDSKFKITLAASSVWINDTIAVGQQLATFDVPPENYVTITVSDTGVSALLRSGSEPLSIIPFE